MASLATLAAEIATDVTALGGITARLTLDHRRNIPKPAAGTTRFALRMGMVSEDPTDSSAVAEVAYVLLDIVHTLASGTDEAAYNEGAKLTDQASLLSRAFWEDMAAVLYAQARPEVIESSERIGNVIRYTVAVRLVLVP